MFARYSANVASPTAVPHPTTQGWTEIGAAAGVTLGGVTKSSTRGWQIVDNAAGTPGYYQQLVAGDYQEMFDHGWRFRAKVKAVSGSGLASWSVTQGNAPAGWNIAGGTGNMVGFEVQRVDGDQFQVKLWQNQIATTINLGALVRPINSIPWSLSAVPDRTPSIFSSMASFACPATSRPRRALLVSKIAAVPKRERRRPQCNLERSFPTNSAGAN